MKKIIVTLLSVFLLFAFFSCKGETGDKGATGATGPSGADGSILIMFQQGIYPSLSYNGVKDTCIVKNLSNFNYGGCQNSGSGTFGTYIATRALIKFDISDIAPSNVIVTKAELTFNLNQIYGSNTYTAYKLTRDWIEGNFCDAASTTVCTWTVYGAGNWTTPGGDYDPSPVSNSIFVSGSLPQTITFSLNTAMVQSWISNPASNYGIIIIADNESVVNNSIFWDTKEKGLTGPMLKVYYKLPLFLYN